METWDASATPPLDVSPRLLDICHCPGKDGPTVMQIIDKQVLRLGLSRYDIKNMVGDGGAENEGLLHGMHAILESDVPGYVRRRCLGHMAWRVADAIIEDIPHDTEVKKVCEYIHKGATWTRLQALATTPIEDHGLGLFGERSTEHARIFSTAPCTIVDGRPESDMQFLRFLGGKEHVLHQLCPRDVVGRNLATATQEAVAILGDHVGRASRRVCAEVLHRALYLHFWVNNHPHISGRTSLEELSQQAKHIIQDTYLDDKTMKRLGCDHAKLVAKGWAPRTWVELAADLEYGDEALAQAAMPQLQELHLRLVTRGTSHLALVVANIMRTSWLAGATLHRDPGVAQVSALRLHRHLDSVAPDKQTPFERHLAENETLRANLQDFGHREHAVCLWQGSGAYKALFQFLAL